jgi:hypothetical protein
MMKAQTTQTKKTAVLDTVIKALVDHQGRFNLDRLPVKIEENGAVKPYKGLNILALGLEQRRRKFRSSVWGTASHLRALTGCLVSKGEQATTAVFAGYKEQVEDPTDPAAIEAKQRKEENAPKELVRIYKHFPLFNADQLDGVKFLADRPASGGPSGADALGAMFARMRDIEEEEMKLGLPALEQHEKQCATALAMALHDAAQGKEGYAHFAEGVVFNAKSLSRVVGIASRCFFESIKMDFSVKGVPAMIELPGDSSLASAHSAQSPKIEVVTGAAAQPPKIEVVTGAAAQAVEAPVRRKRSSNVERFDILAW